MSDIHVSEGDFGEHDGQKVHLYKITNQNGMEVGVISMGATLVSVKVPDVKGNIDEVAVWHTSFTEYIGRLEADQNPYFGSLVGRVANRIKGGEFTIDGVIHTVDKNAGGSNTLHGGFYGFDRKIWQAHSEKDGVTMSYTSPDREAGFPGEVKVEVRYTLTNDNELKLNYKATSSAPTPIALTSHGYFNLDGQQGGDTRIFDHKVQIFADYYTPLEWTTSLAPTGKFACLGDQEEKNKDLRKSTQMTKELLSSLTYAAEPGFDFNYVLRGAPGLKFAARVDHAKNGRFMEVYTDQPGIQFYTGNYLGEGIFTRQDGKPIGQWGALCLEAQNHPDAANHKPYFPDSILRPKGEYRQETIYKFGVTI